MKNIASSIAIILFVMTMHNAMAQSEGTNEFKVGYGAFSSIQFLDLASDLTITGATAGNLAYDNKKFSNTLYGSYKHALNDNIMLGATFAYERIEDDAKSGKNIIGKRDSKNYTAAVEADYYYMSDTFIRMYSGLGLGYSFNNQKFRSSDPDYKNQDDNLSHFNFHVNAFGIRVGNALGVFAEVGFGYKGIVNAGLSYQF